MRTGNAASRCQLPSVVQPGHLSRLFPMFGLLAVVTLGSHLADSPFAQVSQHGCGHEVCKHMPGLAYQGIQACASPPVDFKRAALTQQAARPRALVAPAGSFDKLHSRPGALRVIYLDYDGHVTQGTPWNGSNATITTTAYDIDGNPGSFSAAEQANITEIWSRIAECYSPWDIDVTTEAPTVDDLINTGSGDTKWGVRVLFGDSKPSPAPGAGGVAYVDVFGAVGWGSAPNDIPCFVLQAGVGTLPKYNADAAVHEVGHTLGLSHDGLYPASDSRHLDYYSGQGSGKVAWAPHMGVGYYVPLVQFSKGEYANANNFEDDLSIIAKSRNGFGYRVDDYASSLSTAKSIPGTAGATSFAVNVSGVIETTSDTDWFKILCGSGTLKLDAVGGPTNTMLDIQLTLYDAKGAVVTTANPADDVIASINQSVTGGTYYLKIDGVGLGNPLTTGYTEYASLGQYTITGSYSTRGIKGAPVLTNTSTLFYGIKQQPVPVNTVLKIADSDNTTQQSATVTISGNYSSGQDLLSFTPNPATMGNITGSFNSGTGTLTLNSAGATATLDQFQNALRAVCYSNNSLNPSNKPRTIDFQTYDGNINSNVISSTVTIGYFYVQVAYNSGTKTLTITDDKNSNSVLITLQGNVLTVQGAGATRIGTSASSVQSVKFTYANDVKIVGNFTGGDDTVSLVAVKSSTSTFNMGDGNDNVSLTYCNISSMLTVNGGNGVDSVTVVGSTIAGKTYTSVP